MKGVRPPPRAAIATSVLQRAHEASVYQVDIPRRTSENPVQAKFVELLFSRFGTGRSGACQVIEGQAREPHLVLLERVVLEEALVDRSLRPPELLHL
jgi:hypothetical protein